MSGFTDSPVETSSGDQLEVKDYIDSLTEFIQQCDTPMTIAIQGDWGSGKTSIMNMIKSKLGENDFPIWFNTWQYSQFDMGSQLSESLLANFLNKVEAKETEGGLSKNLFRVIGMAKNATLAAIEMSGIGGNLVDKLDKFLEAKIDSSKVLEVLKIEIQKAVKAKLGNNPNKRIVIFIDDLDRLAPEKAIELLEVLKNFLDVKQCVFVLAVDYSVITQGLIKKFGDQIGHNKGRSFFDKIIQLPFTVPTAQYDIKKYIDNLIKDVVAIDSEKRSTEAELYKSIINESIGCNPRGLKRIFNTFILLNKVAEKRGLFIDDTIINAIRKSDKQRILFSILCMQMAHSELYEFITSHSHNLNEQFFNKLNENLDLDKQNQSDDELDDESNNCNQNKAAKEFIYQIKNDIVKFKANDLPIYFSSLSKFLYAFEKSIDIDKSGNISSDEYDIFKSLLKLSAITSSSQTLAIGESNNIGKYEKFWLKFLEDASRFNLPFFKNNKASEVGFISYSIQKYKNFYVEVQCLKQEVKFRIKWDLNSKVDWNKLIIYKDEIDQITNGSLYWQSRHEVKSPHSFIVYTFKNHGFNYSENWDIRNPIFFEEIMQIYNVLTPYFEKSYKD